MRIFFVDDNQSVLSHIPEFLENARHDIVSCSSIYVVNELFENSSDDFHCVITGLNMLSNGLTEEETKETHGGMFAGWVWLKNYIMNSKLVSGRSTAYINNKGLTVIEDAATAKSCGKLSI